MISIAQSHQIAQIAEALSYLHHLSIIHADIKGVGLSADPNRASHSWNNIGERPHQRKSGS